MFSDMNMRSENLVKDPFSGKNLESDLHRTRFMSDIVGNQPTEPIQFGAFPLDKTMSAKKVSQSLF